MIRFAVPHGKNVLFVGDVPDGCEGQTTEDRLRNAGKMLLGTALVAAYGWRKDGEVFYITKPIDNEGFAQTAFLRMMYEDRALPLTPVIGEDEWVINDLGEPCVRIRHVSQMMPNDSP